VQHTPEGPLIFMDSTSSDFGHVLAPGRKKRQRGQTKKKDLGRPPNAFILFRAEYSKNNKYLNMSVKEVSKKAGESWRDIPVEERTLWEAKAVEKKEQHAKENPDYHFHPKRRTPKKGDTCSEPSKPNHKSKSSGHCSTSSVSPISKVSHSHSNQMNEFSWSAESPAPRPAPRSTDTMSTWNDALALDPFDSLMTGLAHSSRAPAGRNSSSLGGDRPLSLPVQNDGMQWLEYGVLDGRLVPELSPTVSAPFGTSST
jgi:hypothetical protein